jgi:PAS domain S-box-containing protein
MDHRAPGEPLKRWRVTLRTKGVAVLAIPIVALFSALLAVYRLEVDLQTADRAVVRSYEIRAGLLELRGLLIDAQAGVAHFSATRHERHVAAFDEARRNIGEAQARLIANAAGDPEAIAGLDQVRLQTADVMGKLDAALHSPDPPPIEERYAVIAALESQIGNVSTLEAGRYAEAVRLRDGARRRLFQYLFICGVLATLATFLVHLVITSRVARRLRVVEENARRLASGLPLVPTPSGSDEIAALGTQLEEAGHLLRNRERELRERESRYRDLFDRAPVPYLESDASGVVRRVNEAACALLRSTPAELIGRPAWDLVASQDQQALRAALTEGIASGAESSPMECEYQFDDGAHITVEVRKNLIRGGAGEVSGTVHSLLDVTERNLAAVAARKVSQYAMELRVRNEQLARALDGARSATVAKSRFLASVSHELRTPLNGIIGFSELLFDQKIGLLDRQQREVLSDILTSSRHLLQLINDILDLSKVEAGKMEFHAEHWRLQDLVSEVRDVVRPLAEKKKLELAIDVPDDLHAHVDGSRFKQVVYNYLSNAVKFTPDGGAISVRVRTEGTERFRLEVEDTGVGIGEEELPMLFQEFSQLPNSRRAGQGTGLGLAITRHIVEAQGGSVGVHSQLGCGSVFLAVLPLTVDPSQVSRVAGSNGE